MLLFAVAVADSPMLHASMFSLMSSNRMFPYFQFPSFSLYARISPPSSSSYDHSFNTGFSLYFLLLAIAFFLFVLSDVDEIMKIFFSSNVY
jgi:hypothetical protein